VQYFVEPERIAQDISFYYHLLFFCFIIIIIIIIIIIKIINLIAYYYYYYKKLLLLLLLLLLQVKPEIAIYNYISQKKVDIKQRNKMMAEKGNF